MFLRRTVAGFFMLFFAVTGAALTQELPREQVSQQTTSQPASTIDADPYARKQELVRELASYADWYRDDSRFYGRLFVAFSKRQDTAEAIALVVTKPDGSCAGVIVRPSMKL